MLTVVYGSEVEGFGGGARLAMERGNESEDKMGNEVRIKLTDEQVARIKEGTGKEMGEIRVGSLGNNPAVSTSTPGPISTKPAFSLKASLKASQKASMKASLKASQKASMKASLKASQKASQKASLKASNKASMKASLKASQKASLKASNKASMKASLKASQKASQKASLKASQKA